MKKFIIVQKKIDDFFYEDFNDAKENADDDEIIVEIEVKEIRRFKKRNWIEVN